MKAYNNALTETSFKNHCAAEGYTYITSADGGMYGNLVVYVVDKYGILWKCGAYQSSDVTCNFSCSGNLVSAEWKETGFINESDFHHCAYESMIRMLNVERKYIARVLNEYNEQYLDLDEDNRKAVQSHIEARTKNFLDSVDELHQLRGYVFEK